MNYNIRKKKKKRRRQELMRMRNQELGYNIDPGDDGYVLGNEGKVDQISCEITGIPECV